MNSSCKRNVYFGDGSTFEVDCNNPVARYPHNPILTPSEINAVWNNPALQVTTVHNAGVILFKDETLMMFRSHLRCGRSVLGIARSVNGVTNWRIDPYPSLKWAQLNDSFAPWADKRELIENESGGVEDPRIIDMGGIYAIIYSAYHSTVRNRVRVSLATTTDFVTFTRCGPMLEQDMRNAVLFPEKIKGRYAGLFRPNDITKGDTGGIFTQIRIGYTHDWQKGPWEISPEPIMQTGGGPSAFSDKIGPGSPLVKTHKGWLNLFHGVRTTMDGNPYVLGIALHQTDVPEQLKMSSIPILFPSKADIRIPEQQYTHVPNVVFSCGMIHRDNGVLHIYYGGCDTVMNIGATHEDVLVELCTKYGQNPITGDLLYEI